MKTQGYLWRVDLNDTATSVWNSMYPVSSQHTELFLMRNSVFSFISGFKHWNGFIFFHTFIKKLSCYIIILLSNEYLKQLNMFTMYPLNPDENNWKPISPPDILVRQRWRAQWPAAGRAVAVGVGVVSLSVLLLIPAFVFVLMFVFVLVLLLLLLVLMVVVVMVVAMFAAMFGGHRASLFGKGRHRCGGHGGHGLFDRWWLFTLREKEDKCVLPNYLYLYSFFRCKNYSVYVSAHLVLRVFPTDWDDGEWRPDYHEQSPYQYPPLPLCWTTANQNYILIPDSTNNQPAVFSNRGFVDCRDAIVTWHHFRIKLKLVKSNWRLPWSWSVPLFHHHPAAAGPVLALEGSPVGSQPSSSGPEGAGPPHTPLMK